MTVKSVLQSLAESPLPPCSSHPTGSRALAAAGSGIGALELSYPSEPLLGWSQFLSLDKCLLDQKSQFSLLCALGLDDAVTANAHPYHGGIACLSVLSPKQNVS